MKISTLFRTAVLLIALIGTSLIATAYDFEVDGIYYDINGNGISVCVTRAFYSGGNYSGDVIIPSEVTYNGKTYSVTEIASKAFYNCNSLTSITIPYTMEYMASDAFYWSSSPSQLIWNARRCSSNGGMYTSGITQVTIGPGVEVLPYEFLSSSKITSVIIPNSVSEIGARAFAGCSELKSVIIPNSVILINDETFLGCSGLINVVIGNSVTSIGANAFKYCSGLTSITIPNSVNTIYYGAFIDCKQLTKIYCKSIMPPVFEVGSYSDEKELFDAATYQNAILYVPDLTYGYYVQTNPWSLFLDIKTMPYSDGGTVFNTEIYPTSVRINDDSQTTNSYFTFGGKRYNSTLLVTGLEPNQIYSASYTKGGIETQLKFYTSDLMMTPEGGTMLDETTVMLKAGTNMADEETICGFDWRRYDGPDDYLGTRVYCPVYGGIMAGTLQNLAKDTFYKFRPFYKSSAGNVYYGDWVTFYTVDADVDFSPVVYTYSLPEVTTTEATLQGVALRGSETITQQGFEYRKATSSTRIKVNATGERMSKTVTGLQPNTKYKFRAFVIAGGETFYGDEVEFITLSNSTTTSGDVDGDGKVNIDDVTALIDILLNGSVASGNADVDGDGRVNIDDVTALIDYLLNGY